MKCEHCHRAEAVTAVTVKRDGVDRELYVCAACSEKLGGGDGAKKTRPRKGAQPEKVTIIDGTKQPPPPFVEELVKATLGFMKEVAEAQDDERHVCPVCKTKWTSVKESGRLGCPACWKAFARHIRAEFLGAEFGPVHRGAAPAIEQLLPDPEAARAVLARDLKDAIAREDYRRAAEIKRKLDGLAGGEGSAT